MITIDLHDYSIIKICKNGTKNDLTNYFKDYYFVDDYNIEQVYAQLLSTFLKVSSKAKIEDTFSSGLRELYYSKLIKGNKSLSFSYDDLVDLLFNKLMLMQIRRENKYGEYEDLFEVEIDKKNVPFSKVEYYLEKNSKKYQKKLQK